jgi:CheY-like chemotaxis protein
VSSGSEAEGFVPAIEEREFRVIGFRGASRKVLVVDDLEANRSVLVDLLQPLGFDVREAVNGRDGIDQAIDWRPDVILMELRMPVLDGNA